MNNLQLREGGIYRRRDGQIVGPAKSRQDEEWPWVCGSESYTKDGYYNYSGDFHSHDLIEEVFLNQPITDEEVVRRFAELAKAGRVEVGGDNGVWGTLHAASSNRYRIAPTPSKTLRIFDREVTQEELRVLKKALGEV